MNKYIKTNEVIKVYSKCMDLVKSMIGTRDGVIAYNEKFRTDLENTCYKASMYNDLQQIIDKAIKFIESYNLPEDLKGMGEAPITLNDLNTLLEILRGE